MICCRVRLSGAIYESSQLSESVSLVIEIFPVFVNIEAVKAICCKWPSKIGHIVG